MRNRMAVASGWVIGGLTLRTVVAVVCLASVAQASLLTNGSNDLALDGGEIPGWTEVVGTTWTQRSASPSAQAGSYYFMPGAGADHELAQTVDVSAYASTIDAGIQRFDFSGYVSGWRDPGDTSQIIVEYEDASGVVLDSWDSGAIYNPYDEAPTWQQLTHSQFAPAGTRQVQVRLIAARNAGTNNDGYFDSIELDTEVEADNTTILTFETGQANNNTLPSSYGSNISEDTTGVLAMDGGTPNIGLTWSGVWDAHGKGPGSSFDTVDPVNNTTTTDIGQMDADTGATITFSVDSGYSLQLNSLRIGHASDHTGAPFSWTITITEVGGSQVFTHTTAALNGDGSPATETVTFDFTGGNGTDYVVAFSTGGAKPYRGAIDNLCFSQAVAIKSSAIAHRAGAVYAPENTLAAIDAVSNKCDMLEIDVRVSSDGHLVVMHDTTVDRTTDGTGNVSALTLAQLKALDAGSWFSSHFAGVEIPTFDEAVLSILQHATPMIERKAGTAAEYVSALQNLGVATNVVVISFDWDFLADVHALDPSIPLGALGSGALTSSKVTTILATGANAVSWNKNDISTAEINMVRSLGAEIFVWTANGADVQTYVDMAVDGIVSDDPGLVQYLTDDQPSSDEAFAEGLVSYWKFDDGLRDSATTHATDLEGRNPGTLQGFDSTPSWTSGAQARFNGALRLDGVDDFVEIPQSTSLDIETNALTISCWVNMDAKPSAMSKSYAGIYDSQEDAYVLYQDKGNSELRFKVADTSGNAARPGINESHLSTGQWHHVVGIYNGDIAAVSGQASIYLDGKLKDVHIGNSGSGVGLTQWVKAGQHAVFGGNGMAGNNWFSGSVDDVAIWRRALSHGELLQVFQSGPPRKAQGTLFIFR
ncbi:MAG: hypothetical protein HN341_01440 [Verrucomicrobia bacterium]|jgi:glycerophosphoryl diester phosphodiesterase|nr:hypothetical protein [Verrucomicrobiota bacterium]